MPVAAVLLDVEGTTTPISFVHRVLFPFARAALPVLLRDRAAEPEVAAALAPLGSGDPLPLLLGFMDEDRKDPALKRLQGIAWRDGYRDGRLRGELYPDVPPALRAWHAAGLRLAVYSSGSVDAQRLLFTHSDAGNLSPLFCAHFDTATGAKRDPASYRAVAAALDLPPDRILFCSDQPAELDAAAAAAFRTVQLARPQDGTQPTDRHPVAADFVAVSALFALPRPRPGGSSA